MTTNSRGLLIAVPDNVLSASTAHHVANKLADQDSDTSEDNEGTRLLNKIRAAMSKICSTTQLQTDGVHEHDALQINANEGRHHTHRGSNAT